MVICLNGKVEGDRGGGGQGGGSLGEKGAGGGSRGGGKRDSQGGGKREKKGKIMQHCAIFRNRKNAKRRGEQQIQGGNRD